MQQISNLLTGCSSPNRKSVAGPPSDSVRISAEPNRPNGSAAASGHAVPANGGLPALRGAESGGLATLAAFGHGGESHEVRCC